MEDEKIVALFFARSEQAIRELDTKYGRVCQKLSYNIVNNRQDAEECVNDAYFGAWNAIPPTKPEPLLAYICKIVRNTSLKLYYYKGAAKRNSVYEVAMQELEEYLSAPDTVETEIEAGELAGIIESFLETLTVENRVIFMRRYAYMDTYSDIAARVGLTEKTVSVRLTRMRKRMKQYLMEREVLTSTFCLGATVFAHERIVEVPAKQETVELEEIGLTLILPDSWEGRYEVIEDTFVPSNSKMWEFCVKSIYDAKVPLDESGEFFYRGTLFTVFQCEDYSMSAEEFEQSGIAGIGRYLFATEDATYAVMYATDVQFDLENSEHDEEWTFMEQTEREIQFVISNRLANVE